MLKIFGCIMAILLTSCVTNTPKLWIKSGGSVEDFEIDRAQCNAQAFSVASGNMYQIAIVQNQCLQGKGWKLQDSNQVNELGNQLLNEREKQSIASKELCSKKEYEVIYAKTPCMSPQINFKNMTDNTKITEQQKSIFTKWREELDASIEITINTEINLNGMAGKKWANYYKATAKPQNDKNNLDLYNEKITWGEYNSKRQEIYLKMNDALK